MEISFSLSGELLRLIFGFSWARLDSRMWSVKYYFVATPYEGGKASDVLQQRSHLTHCNPSKASRITGQWIGRMLLRTTADAPSKSTHIPNCVQIPRAVEIPTVKDQLPIPSSTTPLSVIDDESWLLICQRDVFVHSHSVNSEAQITLCWWHCPHPKRWQFVSTFHVAKSAPIYQLMHHLLTWPV
ncbi:uncharacterized protein BO96DRAFT_390986 [Aspergillus niger CBS 101883]|uniref:Uncharacterized protein n=2 Tax=Aspergillus niger TaxID=5061 RepID=A2QNU8_ASPNC|nr:uncharacterized protein BO96DRAFT_390986 [Aspergillus niger CBS 101883]XP_059600997.1 hypothetical protein An07g07080 [Aspergillus niger]PYH57661.1 hypothetical protein BO96DRAFT_390986 [Aspergillus niger CBS 101883]CAK39550.1 hypothetical protein An07g07080 [Aspergillus niger]